MASSIEQNLQAIKTAVYGEEVRTAIHDSIEQCYTDTTTGKTTAETAAEVARAAAELAMNAASGASAEEKRFDILANKGFDIITTGQMEQGSINGSGVAAKSANALRSASFMPVPSGTFYVHIEAGSGFQFFIRFFSAVPQDNADMPNYIITAISAKKCVAGDTEINVANMVTEAGCATPVCCKYVVYGVQNVEDPESKFWVYRGQQTLALASDLEEARTDLTELSSNVSDITQDLTRSIEAVADHGSLSIDLGEYEQGLIGVNGDLQNNPTAKAVGLRSSDYLDVIEDDLTLSLKPGTMAFLRFYDANKVAISDLNTNNSSSTVDYGGSGYGSYSATEEKTYTVKNPIAYVAALNAAGASYPTPVYWKWTIRVDTGNTPQASKLFMSKKRKLVLQEDVADLVDERTGAMQATVAYFGEQLDELNTKGYLPFELSEFEPGSISVSGAMQNGNYQSIAIRSTDYMPIFEEDLTLTVKSGCMVMLRFYDENKQTISDLNTANPESEVDIGKSGYNDWSRFNGDKTYTVPNPVKYVQDLNAAGSNYPIPAYWKCVVRANESIAPPTTNDFIFVKPKHLIVKEDLPALDQDPWTAISALTAKINALENQLAMQPTDGHDALFAAEVADTVSKIDAAIAAERANGGVPLCFAFVTDSHIDVPEFNSDDIYNNRNYWADTVANIKSVNNGIASYTYSLDDATQTQKGFDAIVHGGDYITRCSNKMTAEKYLTRSAASLDSIARNFFGVMGNHDGNRQNHVGYGNRNKHISKKEFNTLVLSTANGSMAVKSNPYDLTYYVDFVPQKIRMIFVDGISSGNNYVITQCSYGTDAMMEEVKEYLNSAPADYRFILVAHGTCVPELFYPQSPSDIPYAARYQTMLAPYATRIIMHLHGHHHRDWIGGKTTLGFYDVSMAQSVPGQETIYSPTEYYDGDSTQGRRLKATNPGPNTDAIAPFSTIGATWAGSKANADATKFYEGRSIEDATYDCWTAFVVQPTLNKVKVIRFGAGGRRIASSATGYISGYDNADGSGLGGDCEFNLDPWPAT